MRKMERPLSPHLQVYRPQLNSVMSISHRLTGILLGAGTLFLVYWLASLSGGVDHYANIKPLVGSFFGQAVLMGWTFALFYHLCNGVRHLFWDAGYGYALDVAHVSGWIAMMASVILTALLWGVVYLGPGVP